MAGFEFNGFLPFSGNLPFKGVGAINGEPINRSNSGYKTIGGYLDPNDVNNTLSTVGFGVVVSSNPSSDPSLFVMGCPAGYVARGILVADNSVLQNDPAKATASFLGIPITVGYDGTYRMQSFSTTQTNSSASPTVSYQAIFRATSAGTGTAPIGTVEFIPGTQVVPTGWQAFPYSFIAEVTSQNGVALEITFNTSPSSESPLLLPYGVPFTVTGTLTSAAAATPVVLLTNAQVGTGHVAHVTGVTYNVNGATAWATTANVFIQDTAAVNGLTIPVANLTGNVVGFMNTANNVIAAPIATNVGFTASDGIQIVGNATGTGSNLIVTVTGYIL